jgi:Iap family predicted aminopeptidase
MRQFALSAVLAAGTFTALSLAQPSANSERLERLAGAALTRGGAYEFLQTLTDSVGARPTGSEASRSASELLRQTLTSSGLENVHAEEYALLSRWRRGTASARMLAPAAAPLLVQSFGWSPGTNGAIETLVVDAGAVLSGSGVPTNAAGAIVLADFPGDRSEPGYVTRGRTARALATIGARALLIPSDKRDRLLDIGCFGNYPRAALPMLSIAREDALRLRRAIARGPVRVSLEMENSLEDAPATERNVIAERRGTSMADRVILVGAHFDSWDTATGANDDGSGVAAIVEVARLLNALDIRGRRTIRFAFFSGEEQAILGSYAYVEAHQQELDRIDAVLIMDEGAGVPRGFRLHGRADLEASLRSVLRPLGPLDATGLSQEASFDQDHGYFLAAGIPALTLWVHPGEYDTHHHAITDTLDKIDRQTLAIDTAVMAVATLALADADAIGRRLSPDERVDLLHRTGLASTITALSEPIRIATRR